MSPELLTLLRDNLPWVLVLALVWWTRRPATPNAPAEPDPIDLSALLSLVAARAPLLKALLPKLLEVLGPLLNQPPAPPPEAKPK